MLTDLDKLATEDEADRLSGVYIRITVLARAQRIDFIQVGREAVAKGLVSTADWLMLREAIGGR
ncbi:hypothetical protein E2C06_34030 [Dankookia rubra]|uniref:Uncharacterized protein n=1 Tax=Dankookia rubra TaxID=1442381 RepID=A0A4V3A991_9PROT|nr:hypothetical protein [Dankookia rubra]TDH58155.1 hypothetical protein E2C06_34030 [Dankookia rubra]